MNDQPRPRKKHDDNPVLAVLRVCDLLDVLQETPEGISLHSATQITKLPKTSVFRYLATLAERGYVEREPDTGVYRLGAAFMPTQPRAIDVLTEHTRAHLVRLRGEFGETASLGLLEGNRILYLDVVDSPSELRVTHGRGQHAPVHATALGKALAAELADDHIRDILTAEGMPRLTEHTHTDPEAFLDDVRDVRVRGWALEDNEFRRGSRSIARAVPGDRFIAGLSLSAPAVRFTLEKAERAAQSMGDHVKRIMRELEEEG